MKFEPGQIVRFTYRFHTGAREDEKTSDFKEVLVLHPNWQGKMHAIDLKRLTSAEREVLQVIFTPKKPDEPPHRLPLVNDIRARMDPLEDVKNPVSFYSKFVKVFLRDKDAYRTYFPARIRNAVTVKRSKVVGEQINPKPLFHQIESKSPPAPTVSPPSVAAPKPASPQSRLDLIRSRQAQLQKPKVERPKIERPKKPR